uniref:DarP family protein n=1 Tax=Candidatus Electrothrix sp. TaxID=2170559 RepID=UPI0040569FE9
MKVSRSEQKRRIKQVEKLVEELAVLPAGLLNELPVDEEVQGLFQEVAGLKGGSRKRQIKYITKLLRDDPNEKLYAFLEKRKGTALQKKKRFHEVEYLRDILIEEAIAARRAAKAEYMDLTEDWSSKVVKDIAAELPSVDQHELHRLAFLFAMSRNKQHSREIFRLLQATQEREAMGRKMAEE